MNISSIIVRVADESKVELVKAAINRIDGCEVAAAEAGKIVATLESQNIDDEIAKFRAVEDIDGVSDVVMVYSYQDLDDDINKAQNNDIEAIVRAMEQKNPSEIKYSGRVPV